MSGAAWLDALAWSLAAIWVLHALATARALRVADLPRLGGERGSAPKDWPSVSIVVPCRDEADRIEEAARSLLAIDYPRKEILVVDDRSTDGSERKLEELRAGCPALGLLRIDDLPPGWLGKCHALEQGASRTNGEWILFTDADITHAPGILTDAVAWAEKQKLDLLTLVPYVRSGSALVHAFAALLSFASVVTLGLWAWSSRRQSLVAAGAGAFLLVRRRAYEAAGGHEPLRLAVVDDVALAAHIRRHGGRTEIRFAGRDIAVPFAGGYGEFLRLCEKNAFAALSFRWSALIAVSAVWGLVHVAAPLIGLVDLRLWPAAAAVWASLACCYIPFARRMGASPWTVLLYPLVALLAMPPIWNSAFATTRRRGVRWRDTTYRLEELRAWRRETRAAR